MGPSPVAQATISNDLIDPCLFGTPETGFVDICTLMFGGGPSPNLFDESGAGAKVNTPSVGNKRKAGKSHEKQNIPLSMVTDAGQPPAKRKKTESAESIVVPSTRPSRANAGGRYKDVRDQVKVGGKSGKGKGRGKATAKGK